MKYYPIDEALARRAKEMNSFFDYKGGSATAAYRQAVDEAVQIAERQKRQVAPMYHEKIDSLLDKIRSTGKGGISADDPEVLAKLKLKLEDKEQLQERMKAVNAYYRKNKTLDGCPGLAPEEIEKLRASMARDWRENKKPYPSFQLTNNNAVIRQVKERIAELTAQKENGYAGWSFEGGTVEVNEAANRLQIFFDEKPDAETRASLKREGFHWSPSEGAWQRQLNDNAVRAANRLECIRPLSGERPSDLQQKKPAEKPLETSPEPDSGWRFYIIADLKTWADNAENRSPLEHFASFEEAKIRFQELRSQSYNSETVEPAPDGRPPARLTLGLESTDGLSAADILHVRQGQNCLVTDFTRSERLREDPAVIDVLSRVSCEIGFDLVQPPGCPPVPFEEWDNPYFPAATPGSIAARFYDLGRLCAPDIVTNDKSREGAVLVLIRLLQDGGNQGARHMALATADLAMEKGEDVRKQADALIRDIAAYSSEGKPREKRKHKPSQER